MMNLKDTPVEQRDEATDLAPLQPNDLAGRWILSRLAAAADEMNKALEEYRFNDAANSIYQFIWHEFCDWYIEMSKIEMQKPELKEGVVKCLLYTLDASLRLLHPFMPFVTEEIWQKTKGERQASLRHEPESIMISGYPKSLQRYYQEEEDMSYIIDAVMGVRTIRGELNISPSLKLSVSIKTYSDFADRVLTKNVQYVRSLARAEEIIIGTNVRKPEGSATAVKSSMEIYVPLKGVLNIASEIDRLNKDIAKIETSIASLNKKLFNDDFLRKAPKEIVDKEKSKYDELVTMKERILESIKLLKEAEVKNES